MPWHYELEEGHFYVSTGEFNQSDYRPYILGNKPSADVLSWTALVYSWEEEA